MARYPRVREQHIAVFGESGSGKTVLVSSFFGPTQDGTRLNDLWDVVADDTGQGNRLLQNYLGMRDHAKPPLPTRFSSTTYYFSLKLRKADNAATRRRTFDTLRLAWHDYPGEWFEESPTSEEESNRRIDTFRSLLRSDVALVLVDAQKLLDYEGEEQRYLKSLLTNLRQGILRLQDDLLASEDPLTEFPRIWILTLSKADLLPEWDVQRFRDLLIYSVTDEIERLRETVQSLVHSPEAMSLGEDFLLLSSAKFELSMGDAEPVKIDVSRQVGIDLIVPIAAILPLERRVQWSARFELPRKVLDSLADGADALAQGLVAGRAIGADRLVSRIPRVGGYAARASPYLVAAVEMAGPQIREINARARETQNYLTAMLSQLRLDLDEGVERRHLLKSRN